MEMIMFMGFFFLLAYMFVKIGMKDLSKDIPDLN